MSRRILFTGDFSGGDTTDIGSMWDSGYTGTANLQLVSQRVRGTVTISQGNYETVNSPSFPNDQWAMLRIATLTDTGLNALTVHLRCADPTAFTCYVFEIANPVGITWNSKVSRSVAGAETELTTENTVTWGAGDYLLGTVEDYALTLWRLASGGNPVTDTFTQVLTWTDTDAAKLSSGRVGMKIYVDAADLTRAEIDYFTAGDFVYSSPRFAQLRH